MEKIGRYKKTDVESTKAQLAPLRDSATLGHPPFSTFALSLQRTRDSQVGVGKGLEESKERHRATLYAMPCHGVWARRGMRKDKYNKEFKILSLEVGKGTMRRMYATRRDARVGWEG
jgi:hypothetical protein